MEFNSLKLTECPISSALVGENTCKDIHADAFQQCKASPLKGLLRSQRGFTLIEAMIVTVVLAAMVATIYIGVVYAEKQTRLNYRHRVATFIASGEIDKQYTLYMKEKIMRPFSGRRVMIDDTSEAEVQGYVSVSVRRNVEYHVTRQYPYSYAVAEVQWLDPATEKTHTVRVREDFYNVEGKVNP